MCDPITILAAVSATGAVVSAMQSARTHETNAAAIETQTLDRQEKQYYDTEEADRNYRRTAGATRAAIGSTNLDIRSFSDVLDDDAKEAALSKMAIARGSAIDQRNLQFQASGERSAAGNALVAGAFNAGTAIAGGYANQAKLDTMRATKGANINSNDFS